MSPSPSVGRIVHYKLTTDDAVAINGRRIQGAGHSENWPEGAQAHVGNPAFQGQVFTAIVVSQLTSDLSVMNVQVPLDGNDSCWVTSIHEGDDNGQWSWPPRV
jgi:hypothetical protein